MSLSRSQFLALSALFLLIWFRFENYFHSYWILNAAAVAIAAALFFPLLKQSGHRNRYVIAGLWLLIVSILAADFIHTVFYSRYSESRFQKTISEITSTVQGRTKEQVALLRDHAKQVQEELQEIESPAVPNVFVQLQDKLGNVSYGWAVYDPNGSLIAWKGQFPAREIRILPGSEEITVYNDLHQQFMRLKQIVVMDDLTYIILVNKPVAADYGIQNRYLDDYNLLTNDLSVRPDLLYNSQVTTTGSPDLTVRNFNVASDFSITLLFKKSQYQEYLTDLKFRLHWWFELAALAYLLFALIYSFFEFVGISGQEVPVRRLWAGWGMIVLLAVFSFVLVTEFSSFGASTLFQNDTGSQKWFSQLDSPGGLFLTSFLLLNALWSLAVLLWKVRFVPGWSKSWLNYGLLAAACLLSAFFIRSYFEYVRSTLFHSVHTLEQPLFQTGILSGVQILGTLWLDLSFLFLIGILLGIGIAWSSRKGRDWLIVFTLQVVSAALFLAYFLNQGILPFITALILYFGIGQLVFFLPSLALQFERLNLFSRFLIALLLFSIVSFVFHFTRFQFAGDLRKQFIEQAAKQVQEQDKVIQAILNNSRQQLDEALVNLSIDPKIPDLAFRLWTRTEMARFGLRSSLEIYDEDGRMLNRFSVNLPRLAIPILDTVLEGGGWGSERRMVLLGNVRKPVHFSVRDIPGVGFLVIEAAQDFESLPFMPPTNPFQELFRFRGTFESDIAPDLNVYDFQWRPLFVSRADLSLSTQQGQNLMRRSASGWVSEEWSERKYDVFYFRINTGYAALIMPAVALFTHGVHLIDLLLFNLFWLSIFSFVFITFFRHYLILHFPSQTVTGFNFFQKLLIAFVVFSMVPIVSFSLVMRNYAWEKQFEEVTSRALNSFSVATKVVGDYLFYRAEEQDLDREQLFSNALLEWISQVTQQDVTFFYNRYLLSSSNRELYAAGLLPEQMPGQIYVDLFLKGQKYSIHEARIGNFRFLNVSGRIYTGRYRDEVITIPFLIEERSLEEEVTELREYMMLTGAGLVLLAVLLGYLLANRFSQPVNVLIQGTGEMSRGNLQYRIRERYRDEFRQLVNSFNTMAASLDEQQTALERRRAYIENILNNITTSVVSIDNTMNVATYNPAAVNLFRMPTPYSGPLQSIAPESSEWEPVLAGLRTFEAHREKFGLQEVALRRLQQEVHLRMTWVPLFGEGQWTGAVLLVEDITEIIRSNRLSAWAEMARRVAHEVKNPLTPIQLSIEHLVRVYNDRTENFGEVLRQGSETILKQVKTLRRLVSDFSQYGRPAVLNRTQVDLESFLNELISEYRFPEGIGIDARIAQDLPVVKIDADKVRGALMNVIENGLQAMNGNGNIRLTAERTDDSSVKIEIQDTGRGVPSDILPRLFEPYFSTKTGGTGLGLAIARKNIEDQGGKIDVRSVEGQGTTVTILLPT